MFFYDTDPSQWIKNPEHVLRLYQEGIFPMAEEGEVQWIEPLHRGVITFEEFHIPRSLQKFMKTKQTFTVQTDKDFARVIEECAKPEKGREATWINQDIQNVFVELHQMGHAHSVECWEGDELVGGLYGLQVGGVFCGESMFSRTPNASKVALVHLVDLLKRGGFVLLDTQFTNHHLEQFGIVEILQAEYVKILKASLTQSALWVPKSHPDISETDHHQTDH